MTSITSSAELGHPKMDPRFWEALQGRLGFDPTATLMVDDSEKVLAAAHRYGIGHLLHIADPSSGMAPIFSPDHPSVLCFSEVLPEGEERG